MRVLLVRPGSHHVHRLQGGLREHDRPLPSWFSESEVELGLLYIASYLERAGHEVSLLDLQLSRQTDKSYRDHLSRGSWNVVGITAGTGYIDEAQRIVELAKAEGALTVMGGHHPSALPQETLEACPEIDYIIHGEGELPMTELLDALENGRPVENIFNLGFRTHGTVRVNPARPPIVDLDDMLFPAWHLVDLKKYRPAMNNYCIRPHANVLASRGCPYSCIFCSRTGSRHSRKYYSRSAENIVEELRYLESEYGVRDIFFVDDTFTYDRDRLRRVCELLIKKKKRTYWSCYACPDEVTEESLRLMKRAGCFHIKYGFEVGTERMIKAYGKSASLQQCVEAVRLTKKAGIEVFGGFIFGYPGETVEEMRQTLRFALMLSPDVAVFQSLVPFPGSSLFTYYDKRGELLSRDWSRYLDTAHRVLPDQTLYGEHLKQFIRNAFVKFYFRPRFIVQKIRRLFIGHPVREIRNVIIGLVELLSS